MASERRLCPDCLREIPPEEPHCLCRGPGTRKAGLPRMLTVPAVTALFGKWLLRGPLLIGENGLYLFLESIERRPDIGKTAGAAAAGVYAGVVGGLALKAMEKLGESALELPPGLRPREEYDYLYQSALPKAPAILRCEHCLELPRAGIAGIELHGDDLLVIHGPEAELEVRGELGDNGAPGFLKLRGYPVSVGRGSAKRRLAWGLALALVAATFAGELFELVSLGEWAGGKTGRVYERLLGAADEAPTERLHRYGTVYYRVRGKLVPEQEVTAREKQLFRLYHWRWVAIMLALGALCLAGFFAHLRWVAR